MKNCIFDLLSGDAKNLLLSYFNVSGLHTSCLVRHIISLAGDEDVCDRKLWRFEFMIFGASRL